MHAISARSVMATIISQLSLRKLVLRKSNHQQRHLPEQNFLHRKVVSRSQQKGNLKSSKDKKTNIHIPENSTSE